MKAINTGVTVRFRVSPFSKKVFIIAEGTQTSAVVIRDSGEFRYTRKCTKCPTPAIPPKIIID